MLQLKNSTPFAASMALFPDENAIDTLYLIVKASFKIGQHWVLSDKQHPPIVKDIYWGEPNQSSLKYASDFHIGKPTTDIVMIGNAVAPNDKEVSQLDVSLSVGQVSKTIRVFGDREWKDGRITPPKPFKTMPIVYEKAFGGVHVISENEQLIEEKNPLGCGFPGNRETLQMNGHALPNLEDPLNLIRHYADKPEPSCFALSSPTWQPRVSFVGTYDDTWQTQRAPYLPLDFDKRFFNMSHKDLVYPSYLRGGEPIMINNMHPDGILQFNVPHINLVSKVEIDSLIKTPEFNLETLIIEPNQLQLSMVWRAAMPCDKKALKINEASIALTR